MPVEKPGPSADYYCKSCDQYVTGQEMHLHKGKCQLVPVDTKKATIKTPPSEVADQLLYDHHFVTLRDTDEIYMWNGRVWIEHGETWIKEIIQISVHNVDTHFVHQVVEQIRRRTYRTREQFTPPPNHINLENGIINVRTMEFIPHDRYYYFTNIMPVTYDKHARCPKILEFMKQCLGSKEIVTVIEEMASTLINLKLEKAYMWIGGGSNGKSTMMKVLQALLGSSSYSVISIHDLLKDRFARSELEGKMANIFPDIGSYEIRWTHTFKAIVSGDEIRADRKNRGSIKLRSRAKMFFSCNELPQIEENTDAIFRRWIFTEWTVQFLGKDRNPKLEHDLTTPSELSGLLNLLLANATKLSYNGDFTYPPSVDQLRREWHERSDHVESFSRQCLTQKADGTITNDRICFLYRKYCEINKLTAESDRTFLNRLRKFMLMDTVTTRKSGKSVRLQKGVMENVDWSKKQNVPLIAADGMIIENFADIPTEINTDVVQTSTHTEPTTTEIASPTPIVDTPTPIVEIPISEESESSITPTPPEAKERVDLELTNIIPKYRTMMVAMEDMTYSPTKTDATWACVCYSCNRRGAGPFSTNDRASFNAHTNHRGVRYLTFDEFLEEQVLNKYTWSGA